jgi:SWIM zinc finger
MTGRLARGRNYARSGQVLTLEISAGYVTATVQGSRPNPYQVRIRVLPLTIPQWRRVEQELASQALYRARLLAGEMPPEIEAVFADCGTPLFPRRRRDMEMSCSCPDWEVPCKHLAAVCYVLAEAFDADPFGMLAWRGRGRDDLLAALRRLTAAEPALPRPVLDVADRPLAGRLADFWSPALTEARLRSLPAVPATVPGLLLRTFEPPAVQVRGKDLAALLAPAYERLAGQPAAGSPGESTAARRTPGARKGTPKAGSAQAPDVSQPDPGAA